MACGCSSIYSYSEYQLEASGQLHATASIPPRTGTLVLSFKKAGWFPGTDCTLWTRKNSLLLCPTDAYITVLTKQFQILDIVVYICNSVIGTAYGTIATLIILLLWTGAHTLHKHTQLHIQSRTCTVLYQVHASHGLLPYPLAVSMQFSDVTSVSNQSK